MSKAEFLKKLSEALREYMDDSDAYEHISYYSSYIDKELKKGYSEEEVTAKLGNPRLIAKSIIDRHDYKAGKTEYAFYDSVSREQGDYEGAEKKSINLSINGKSVNPIAAKIVAIIAIIFVVAIAILVVWGISWIMVKVVLPIALIALLFGLIISLINSSKRK